MRHLAWVLIPAVAAGALAAESDEGAAIRAAQEFDGSVASVQAALGRRCGPFELELSDCYGLHGTARIHCELCAAPSFVPDAPPAGETTKAESEKGQVPNPCFGAPNAGKAPPEDLSTECRKTVANVQEKISRLDEDLVAEKEALSRLPDDSEARRRVTDLTPAERAALSRIERLSSARVELIKGLSEIGKRDSIPAEWTQDEPESPAVEAARPETGRLAPDHDCVWRPKMACCPSQR